jgi:hypothetical protein
MRSTENVEIIKLSKFFYSCFAIRDKLLEKRMLNISIISCYTILIDIMYVNGTYFNFYIFVVTCYKLWKYTCKVSC